MNISPAPLSMSRRVLTVWFSSVCLIEIGMDNKFDLIVARFTEKMSSTGQVDVDVVLHFKNPLSLPPGKIPLSHLCLTMQ